MSLTGLLTELELEGIGSTRKGDAYSQVPASPFTMVAERGKCTDRSTITPNKTCTANIYRHIKRRVVRSLKRAHCKRNLVPSGKQAAYQLFGTKSSLSSFIRVPRSLLRQDSSTVDCGVIHKQGRRHEVGSTVCPTVENLNLLFQETSNSQSPTHPRPAVCGSRQAIQARPDHSDGVVPPSRGVQTICTRWPRPEIDLFATRFNKLPQQWMHSVCFGRIWTHTPSHQQPYWAKWWRSCRTPHARKLF